MRTLKGEYHLRLPVSEDLYKVDMHVVDRYLAFSGELMRMASLGLAAYGFLISDLLAKGSSIRGVGTFTVALADSRYLLAIGAVSFGVSVATALAHRYYATECLTHFVRGLRLDDGNAVNQLKDELKIDSVNQAESKRSEISKAENSSLEADLKMSKWTIRMSATALAAGAGCVAWAIAVALIGVR